MVDPGLLSEPDEVEELLRSLKEVSKLPPEEVFSYLIGLSEAVLVIYILLRDSLPRDYGRIKFSRFVEKKRRQVENMRSIARELYPNARTTGVHFSWNLRVETVGDYVKVLENAVHLESIALRAFEYLANTSGESLLFSDLAEEIEDNLRELRRELERAKKAEAKLRFSDFVKELVGEGDGRI